jgi:hypothetical protein
VNRHLSALVASCFLLLLGLPRSASLARAGEIRSPDFSRLPPIETRTVATSSGEVLSTTRTWVEKAPAAGQPEVVVRSRTFQPSTTVEERTLLRFDGTVRCLEEARRVIDAQGQTVASSMKQFRHEAIPFSADAVPTDTYPPGAALLYLLGYLSLDADAKGSFHLMGEAMVWKMLVWSGGSDEISVPAGRFACRRLRMRPDPESLGFPAFLRPFVRYFIPEFDVWIAADPPYLTVRLTGPLGPARDRDVVVELVNSGAAAP